MARSSKFRIVLVTCSTPVEARKIAKAVVNQRLAACVNILGASVESIYWWKKKVETARERLLIMKTIAARVKELENEVRRLHSYHTPEFIVLSVETGSRPYLSWLAEVLA